MLAALVGGCQLVGYEVSTRAVEGEQDASVDVLDDGGGIASGEASVGAGQPPGRDANTSDAPQSDAECASDADACGTAANACGGATVLTDQPNDRCGQCGLGRYACDGTDALSCNGGDARPVATGSVLIDDYEDDDDVIASGNGITFSFTDGTGGTITPSDRTGVVPAEGGANGTQYAARITGQGFTDWGAGMIILLNDKSCGTDASTEHGVEFWMKGSSNEVTFSVTTPQTLDAQYCGTKCTDFFSKKFTPTSAWTRYDVKWSDLAQGGFGTATTFDPTQVRYLQFQFDANVSFDLWVDEVRFY